MITGRVGAAQERRQTGIVMLLTNPATFDQRPLKEAHCLARAGWDVTILAWDRELETAGDSSYDDGLVIKRMRLGAGHGTPVLTVPKLFIFYAWCLAHLLTSRVAAIHCHDVDTLPVGYAAKALKFNRPRLVYDMHDLPEAFLRFFPLVGLTSSVAMSTARSAANAILVVNEKFVSYLGKVGFNVSRLVVVMNAPPLSTGRKEKTRGKEFNILYYGWLGEERGVKLLLEAVQGLDGVRLTLAGRGELEGLVRQAASKSDAVRFLGWLKMEALDPEIRRADLIPSLYEPRTRNALMATPGKLLTAMSLAIPTLVPAGTYQAEIVQRHQCGIVVEWKDPGDVREAVRRLRDDGELYAGLAAASYEAFRSTFSWEAMCERLDRTYKELIPT